MHNKKAALRRELLSLRRAATSYKLKKEELSGYDAFIKAKTVFCYVSAHGEVDTLGLIEELLSEKTVVVPYCVDTFGNMICCEIHSLSDLTEGKFGIPEPKNPLPFPKEKIDFVIVPGVAFDKNGYRLGYGKGYYDRFLKDISPYKLGVCRKEFYLDTLPHDKHDIKMNDVYIKED